ncbi:hypothetical protein WOLCODRAFT_135583 [Wolfiporia cocos MD-104 SS10]|uniref:Uncharacterized protein n=1 Tax=Wolfiporia cocos (strain MD-104) TaxID=742152 RepID=A0A2H3J660_WOLCO|nr:hypothetical protein WOLCODRAFT_135583 [Wolfiporia cocos MD-104 SS10]
MLSRASPALCALRGAAARHGLSAIRLNSSQAPEGAANPEGAAPAPKRSIPKADIYGDIHIPTKQGRSDFNFVSFLGDDEFDLSARLQSRQPSSSPSWRPSPPAGQEAGAQPPRPQNRRAESGEASRINGRDTNRQSDQDRPFRRRDSQDGYGSRQRASELRIPSVLQGRNRPIHPIREHTKNRPAPAQIKQTSKVEGAGEAKADEVQAVTAVKAETSSKHAKKVQATQEAQVQSLTSSMAIQTTDLGKLFGPADAARSITTPTTRTSASARRIQRALERRAGDYSRYLDPSLGTTFPEQLGPLGTAKLCIGRRREAGLRQRRNVLGIVQHLVVQKVADPQI